MDVRNCRSCGRLFNYYGGGYMLCQACTEELDKKFAEVKKYIRHNPKATMPQIAEDNDVSIIQIERWIREERLTFADDSPIGIECEGCGVTIKSGRFCDNCKSSLQNSLSNAYGRPQINKPVQHRNTSSSSAKMRFLE